MDFQSALLASGHLPTNGCRRRGSSQIFHTKFESNLFVLDREADWQTDRQTDKQRGWMGWAPSSLPKCPSLSLSLLWVHVHMTSTKFSDLLTPSSLLVPIGRLIYTIQITQPPLLCLILGDPPLPMWTSYVHAPFSNNGVERAPFAMCQESHIFQMALQEGDISWLVTDLVICVNYATLHCLSGICKHNTLPTYH